VTLKKLVGQAIDDLAYGVPSQSRSTVSHASRKPPGLLGASWTDPDTAGRARR
jgi:hypothetical protein